MDVVPLFPEVPIQGVQGVTPELPQFGSCAKCSLARNAAKPCAKPRGKVGEGASLLVVGEVAPPAVSAGAKAFCGVPSESWFVRLLEPQWSGTIVYDYALKCTNVVQGGSNTTLIESHHNNCRPHLAYTFGRVSPDRVILLGNHAAKGFLGYDRGAASNSNRRGYTWLFGDKDVPVFLMSQPEWVYENSFLRQNFKADLEWALNADPPKLQTGAFAYDLHPDDGDLVMAAAEKYDSFSYDVEASGLMFTPDYRVLSVAVSFPGHEDVFVWFGDALKPTSKAGKALKDLMLSERWGKKGQNIVYDVGAMFCHLGEWPANIIGDTRLAYKLLNSGGVANLEQMAELVGWGGHKQEAEGYVAAEVKKIRANFRKDNPGVKIKNCKDRAYAYAALPRDVNVRYVARDAKTTDLLADRFEGVLRKKHENTLWKTYQEVSVPSATTFAKMMHRGIPVSNQALVTTEAYFNSELSRITEELSIYGDVNPSSPKSVMTLLYHNLKLRPPRGAVTKGGALSTAKDVLEKMSNSHPAVAKLLEYREIDKLRGMVESLRWQVCPDSRIRPMFLADGTETGRISVTGGLHQVPARTANGKRVKKCFVAKPGHVVLQADYSTLEIRVAAILSGDPLMLEVLNSGIDFHLATAKMLGPIIWSIDGEEVERRHKNGVEKYRIVCKTINFATLYGQSTKELASKITGMLRADGSLSADEEFTEREAQAAQDAILGQYKVLAKWIAAQQREVSRTGEVWTWWDGNPARRRLLYDAGNASRGDLRGSALRSSYNTPIQGTGAEFCNRSLNEIVRVFDTKYGDLAYPVLSVHDSVILEVVDDHDTITQVANDVVRIMTQWNSVGVPIKVDVEVGPSWGEMSKVSL